MLLAVKVQVFLNIHLHTLMFRVIARVRNGMSLTVCNANFMFKLKDI